MSTKKWHQRNLSPSEEVWWNISKNWDLKGQCHDIQWFFILFFCVRGKKWRLLTQVSWTSHHDSSVSRTNSFTGQAESFSSSNCRFPRPCLVAAISFPHTKWLPKITDYRDTAALSLETKEAQGETFLYSFLFPVFGSFKTSVFGKATIACVS